MKLKEKLKVFFIHDFVRKNSGRDQIDVMEKILGFSQTI